MNLELVNVNLKVYFETVVQYTYLNKELPLILNNKAVDGCTHQTAFTN
jgi:hypothetical protein